MLKLWNFHSMLTLYIWSTEMNLVTLTFIASKWPGLKDKSLKLYISKDIDARALKLSPKEDFMYMQWGKEFGDLDIHIFRWPWLKEIYLLF